MSADEMDRKDMEGAGQEAGAKPGEDPEEYYRAGLFLVKRNRSKEALQAFRRAFELDNNDPRFMSYYGLCLADVSGRLKEGLALCEKAASREFYRAELFLNLAKVYLRIGNRRKAHNCLRKGMALDRDNGDIRQELISMGVRKPPVLPFLDRNNALNKIAGKVLYKLRLR